MNYSDLHDLLKSILDLNQQRIKLLDEAMTIEIFEFKSAPQAIDPKIGTAIFDTNIKAILQDNMIEENRVFRYPVFVPSKESSLLNPIILLHGLNERSWIKYLPWAYRLAELTGRAVILFPIAYHMNRSPEQWGDPRKMQQSLSDRKANFEDNNHTSFANVALSNRLSNHPIRFFTSGRQSANDLILLLSQLKDGKHELFPISCYPDFFAYSIGAFLSQILFLANPSGLIDKSKLFLFCGGAYFYEMNGISKMIMDKVANERIIQYYLEEFKNQLIINDPLKHYFSENLIVKGFWSMIAEQNNATYRQKRFEKLKNQISGISLKKDTVIPATAISKVIPQVEMLDFDFEYSHEVPFPLGNTSAKNNVNSAFDEVFNKASDFFNNKVV